MGFGRKKASDSMTPDQVIVTMAGFVRKDGNPYAFPFGAMIMSALTPDDIADVPGKELARRPLTPAEETAGMIVTAAAMAKLKEGDPDMCYQILLFGVPMVLRFQAFYEATKDRWTEE